MRDESPSGGSAASPVPGSALYGGWARSLEKGWDEPKARALLSASFGTSLKNQEASEQSPFKMSYIHEG